MTDKAACPVFCGVEYRVKRIRFRRWRWTVEWETDAFEGTAKGVATSQLLARAEADAYLADVRHNYVTTQVITDCPVQP